MVDFDGLELLPQQPPPAYTMFGVGTSSRIGLAIKERRRQLGLTQLDLAKQAGVSRGWISRIEHGKVVIHWSHLCRVLGALKLRLDAHGIE